MASTTMRILVRIPSLEAMRPSLEAHVRAAWPDVTDSGRVRRACGRAYRLVVRRIARRGWVA